MSAFSTSSLVPIGRINVARPEPIIMVLQPAMVVTFPLLFLRVWKCLISLSIVLVVQLSTKQISSSIRIVPIV
jgi:hypothetical protein